MRSSFRLAIAVFAACGTLACSGGTGAPTMPSTVASPADTALSAAGERLATSSAEQPPFNLEAILHGVGFGHVKYRQEKNPDANIIQLGIWVRDLAPNTTYSFQRAVDTILDGVCTSENWLTLGQGATPYPIVTDSRGTGRADLWRDLTNLFAAGTAFDIHFRVVEAGTTNVVLQSDCYRFIVRD
jgi:hypothetical protein